MTNDIDKTSPHYKGEFGSIYEVNQKFPSGGVEGDYVAIDGWAHYWNADRGTWCVNAQRDSYWDELITNIIEHFKTIKGATYMGVATTGTVPDSSVTKMFYFSLQGGKYANFGNKDVAQGINVLLTEDGKSWTVQSLISVAQELGASTTMLVSQKVTSENINLMLNSLSSNSSSKNLFNRFDLAYNGRGCCIAPETGKVKFRDGAGRISHLINIKSDVSALTVSSGTSLNAVFGYRFFDSDFNIINFGAFNNSSKMTVSIPENAVYFQFSYSVMSENIQVEYGDAATAYEEYQSEYEQKISSVISRLNNSGAIKLPYLKVNAVSMSKDNSLEILDTPNLKTWHTIGFMANITTFGKIKISHGTNKYAVGIVEIDETNIYTYNATNENEINAIPHNLTIKDYVVINIKVEDTIKKASLVIGTNGGMVRKDIPWGGCKYNVIAEEESTGVYQDALLTIGGVGLRKDIWVFGDSYADTWTAPMKQKYNYGNFMIDGYSGRKSRNAYISLLNCLKIGKPKIIVWMMGMNDPDNNDSVNASWKDSFDKCIDICKQNGIIFLPCTIPNVPDRIMKYKNDIIRGSKLQYIDVASYLGASNIGSNWYDGLLSSDNVHPSNLGSTKIAELLFTELSLMQG